ncbi:hypothetical protein CCUS01_09698 [Colletotrichum cuscutae]|uniref:C2H2-type domain-containing protein n=1 Tax=Colletotrichum cuscutae TaxID=1209917 RepID=A0AAI9UJD1_9PEZI|nr:hypothetical protein CCUS01_09698 [Colletotrichum cuscutae]
MSDQEARSVSKLACEEPGCNLKAFSTRSNLIRHNKSKHGQRVRMPCGKNLPNHACNCRRHKKSCQSVVQLLSNPRHQKYTTISGPLFTPLRSRRSISPSKPTREAPTPWVISWTAFISKPTSQRTIIRTSESGFAAHLKYAEKVRLRAQIITEEGTETCVLRLWPFHVTGENHSFHL